MSSGWRLSQQDQPCLGAWNVRPPSSGAGDGVHKPIDCACIMKPHKFLKLWGVQSFWAGGHMHVLGGWCTPTPGDRRSRTWDPPELAPCSSSSSSILSHILNQQQKGFSGLYEQIPKLERGLGEPGQTEGWVTLRPPVCDWSLKWGGQPRGMEPFTCGACANSRWLVTELN